MPNSDLGNVEKQVLRALRDQPSATVEQITELLGVPGASSVAEANAALARNNLVEPVPGGDGALRLTDEGARLAGEIGDIEPDPGSGGGRSEYN